MELLGVLLFLEEKEKKREKERAMGWRIPKDATPSDWAAVLGGS